MTEVTDEETERYMEQVEKTSSKKSCDALILNLGKRLRTRPDH